MSHACHRFWKCHKTLTFLPALDKVHNPSRLPRETTSELPKVARTCGVFNILTSKCASFHNSVHFRHLNSQKWSEPGVLCTFWLGNVLRATTAYTFSTSELPKVVRTWCALYILTWKCASRHNGVHFFDIWTPKSGPSMVCFVHFDFEVCFAPQRRALFRHLNSQKWSEHAVFRTFWLGNALRATTACTFSSLIWPAGSALAALASLFFSTLRSHKSLEKHCFSRLCYLFAHLDLLSSDSFSFFFSSLLWLFPSLLFICPYCRKFDF